MNSMLKIKRRWWQIVIFAEEAYLALTALVLFVLASGRIDVDGPTAAYMFWSYLAVIVASLISGLILIVFGKRRSGSVVLAFAVGAFVLLILLLPAFAAAKRRA
jgi:hypothetical protein